MTAREIAEEIRKNLKKHGIFFLNSRQNFLIDWSQNGHIINKIMHKMKLTTSNFKNRKKLFLRIFKT
ncbi:MAG TPA: hypothetical protein GXX15_10395 [Clostridia bacterium]|nr:hypothetical protein [Clostridia bacterium]